MPHEASCLATIVHPMFYIMKELSLQSGLMSSGRADARA
jgi:hypothetical protein